MKKRFAIVLAAFWMASVLGCVIEDGPPPRREYREHERWEERHEERERAERREEWHERREREEHRRADRCPYCGAYVGVSATVCGGCGRDIR